jgi:hypothetical protein
MELFYWLLLFCVVMGIVEGARKINETRNGIRPGVVGDHGILWWLFR